MRASKARTGMGWAQALMVAIALGHAPGPSRAAEPAAAPGPAAAKPAASAKPAPQVVIHHSEKYGYSMHAPAGWPEMSEGTLRRWIADQGAGKITLDRGYVNPDAETPYLLVSFQPYLGLGLEKQPDGKQIVKLLEAMDASDASPWKEFSKAATVSSTPWYQSPVAYDAAKQRFMYDQEAMIMEVPLRSRTVGVFGREGIVRARFVAMSEEWHEHAALRDALLGPGALRFDEAEAFVVPAGQAPEAIRPGKFSSALAEKFEEIKQLRATVKVPAVWRKLPPARAQWFGQPDRWAPSEEERAARPKAATSIQPKVRRKPGEPKLVETAPRVDESPAAILASLAQAIDAKALESGIDAVYMASSGRYPMVLVRAAAYKDLKGVGNPPNPAEMSLFSRRLTGTTPLETDLGPWKSGQHAAFDSSKHRCRVVTRLGGSAEPGDAAISDSAMVETWNYFGKNGMAQVSYYDAPEAWEASAGLRETIFNSFTFASTHRYESQDPMRSMADLIRRHVGEPPPPPMDPSALLSPTAMAVVGGAIGVGALAVAGLVWTLGQPARRRAAKRKRAIQVADDQASARTQAKPKAKKFRHTK